MTAPKKAAARPSRSRAQVKEDFEDLSREVRATETVDSKTAEATRSRHARVNEAIQSVTVNSVLEDAVKLKLNTARALDDVTEQIARKTSQLSDISEAIQIKEEELEKLHNIDLASTAIDLLVTEHKEKSEQFQKEILDKRSEWAREDKERQDALVAERQRLDTDRRREIDQYEYTKRQERQKKEDEFSQKMLLQERELASKRATAEAEISAKQKEYELSVANFEQSKASFIADHEKIVSDLKRENAIAMNALKRDASDMVKEVRMQLDSDKKLFEAEIKNLTRQLESKDQQITALTNEVSDARNSVKEISKAAIDGASEKSAFNQFLSATNAGNNGSSAGKARA